MAIPANTCYNSHTPISLGVSFVSVPAGILLEVHPTTEVIDRSLPDDCENHCWAFAPIYNGNIHIHLIRSLLRSLLMYMQQRLLWLLQECLQITRIVCLFQMDGYGIRISYLIFPTGHLTRRFLTVLCDRLRNSMLW